MRQRPPGRVSSRSSAAIGYRPASAGVRGRPVCTRTDDRRQTSARAVGNQGAEWRSIHRHLPRLVRFLIVPRPQTSSPTVPVSPVARKGSTATGGAAPAFGSRSLAAPLTSMPGGGSAWLRLQRSSCVQPSAVLRRRADRASRARRLRRQARVASAAEVRSRSLCQPRHTT
jgi:hypothetical protein